MTGISNNYNLNRVDYQKTQKNEKEEKQVVEEAKVEEKKPEENAKAVDLGNQASALYGQAMIKPKKAEAADVNNDRPEKIDVELEEDPNNPVEKTTVILRWTANGEKVATWYVIPDGKTDKIIKDLDSNTITHYPTGGDPGNNP